MKSKNLGQWLVTIGFLGILGAMFLSVIGQFLIRNVAIELLHMDNGLTNLSVTGADDYYVDVNWEEEYPYEEGQEPYENVMAREAKEADAHVVHINNNPVAGGILSVVNLIDQYASDYLAFKEEMKVPSAIFDSLIGNRMVDESNIFLRTKREDLLLVRSPFKEEYTAEELDVTELADSVEGLADYLKAQGIDFLYVQSPMKEDVRDASYMEQYGPAYSTLLADELMKELQRREIDTLDLRKNLEESGRTVHESFFETDNHWNIDTALWATGEIAKVCNEKYGFTFSLGFCNPENFFVKTFEDFVQGTIGRSVTLWNQGYDDINVFVPKYDTNLRVEIPSRGLDLVGEFTEVLLNPVNFKNRSTVYHCAYDGFAYSKPPVTEITNYMDVQNNEKSILFLRESFAGPVLAYLSLGVGRVTAVTPEGFTGSIESYIAKEQPDLVIVLYTAPTTNQMSTKYDFK